MSSTITITSPNREKTRKERNQVTIIGQHHSDEPSINTRTIYTHPSASILFSHLPLGESTSSPIIIQAPRKYQEPVAESNSNLIIHLMLTALGTVAGKAQGLVGHELSDAGVDGGSDGDTGSYQYRKGMDIKEGYTQGRHLMQ